MDWAPYLTLFTGSLMPAADLSVARVVLTANVRRHKLVPNPSSLRSEL